MRTMRSVGLGVDAHQGDGLAGVGARAKPAPESMGDTASTPGVCAASCATADHWSMARKRCARGWMMAAVWSARQRAVRLTVLRGLEHDVGLAAQRASMMRGLQLVDQRGQEDDHRHAAGHAGQDQRGLHARPRAGSAGPPSTRTAGATPWPGRRRISRPAGAHCAAACRGARPAPSATACDEHDRAVVGGESLAISTPSMPRRPSFTGTRSARPSRTASTHGDWRSTIAHRVGRQRDRVLLRPATISTETVMSGCRNGGGRGTRSLISIVPRCASIHARRDVVERAPRTAGRGRRRPRRSPPGRRARAAGSSRRRSR